MNDRLIATGLTVAQLADALQRLVQDGHGDRPAHALAGGAAGPVRSVEFVLDWDPTAGTVALLNVDADESAPPDLLAIAREVDRLLTAQRWLANEHAPESRLLMLARAALDRHG
ncbi:hypothetical protein CBM2589_U10266 [Cupriavidus taiwanensis]|uniref:Uncharacterized protein n=1 Tax=Cupriavidus taiwanensis TaxID=164546 RepID=A0A375CQR7_9BURK|nr:hypothetical protein [Cupriavidus taiwanensis]SOY77764.1 hypothetical protein CBM2589_U10266 [Cupriavidus taiwanensis]